MTTPPNTAAIRTTWTPNASDLFAVPHAAASAVILPLCDEVDRLRVEVAEHRRPRPVHRRPPLCCRRR
jgi:hypothetical protein